MPNSLNKTILAVVSLSFSTAILHSLRLNIGQKFITLSGMLDII
jgi:hypothetical protein